MKTLGKQISAIEQRVEKQTHTYMGNEFLTKLPGQFGGEKIVFQQLMF